jgi:hypothetical protein
MKYVKAIFENENVQSLATTNEELIQFATEHLLVYNVALEQHILENVEDFIIESDLTATYENIRNTVAHENIIFINEVAEIIRSDNSVEEKAALIEGKLSERTKALYQRAKDAAKKGWESTKGAAKKGWESTKSTAKKVSSSTVDAGKAGLEKVGKLGNKGKGLTNAELQKAGAKRLAIGTAGLGALGIGGKLAYDKYND